VLLAVGPLLAACSPPRPPEAAAIYEQACATCHGADGKGSAPMLAIHAKVDLTQSALLRTGDRDAIARRIAQGGGPMPAFSRLLTPEQIALLAIWCQRYAENS
jgi:mono/diheme cytochrome c family protein